MHASTVAFDDSDALYDYDAKYQVNWNGKTVKIDKSNSFLFLEKIKPMMSGGNLSSGASYSEKEGFKVEVKIDLQLGPTNNQESRPSENNSNSNTDAQTTSSDNQGRDSGNGK